MKRFVLLALLLAVMAPVPVRGQQETGPRLRERGQPFAEPGIQNAQNTRQELQNILWQLPPSVRGVLQNDPSLIERPDYLAPYPELAEFLKQHPEVARNPTFFFGRPEDFRRASDPLDMFAGILAGTALFLSFMTLLFIVGSVARQVVEYRRWVRQTRIQTEVHTKILDRLQTNEDLLAYVQTPAGRHFLEFAPLAAAGSDPGMTSAPLGRILWSVQAGVVLAALGIGLRYAQGTVPEEIVPAFTVLGVIVMSLGIGAVISAIIAYVLSARLGLLPTRRQETNA
jgi:hypothetical protein